MNAEIEQYIKSCGRCISRKSLPQNSSLNQITSNGPLDLVCIDFLFLESDSKGIANVLVVTDHFTLYVFRLTSVLVPQQMVKMRSSIRKNISEMRRDLKKHMNLPLMLLARVI